jgi:hypothetical protein
MISEADIRLAIAYLDLEAYADTDLGLELPRIIAGEAFLVTAVAGLQFYRYGRHDPLRSEALIPSPGDRLSLVRRPDNPADTNAIEVWWKNEHLLGHIPRALAADLAPVIDQGQPLRSYVLRPGNGGRWDLQALLVSRAIDRAARTWFSASLKFEIDLHIEVESDRVWGPRYPSPEKRRAAEAWDDRLRAARQRRRSAIIERKL